MTNENGRFGIHGGQYIPETLMNAVIELEESYNKFKDDPEFVKELNDRAQKKNSKSAALKEVQLHISIGAHDLATKAKHARGFLDDGDKVNVRVVLKGREMAHQEIGEELLRRFIAMMEEGGPVNIEKAPSWEGKCYSAILASKSKKQ